MDNYVKMVFITQFKGEIHLKKYLIVLSVLGIITLGSLFSFNSFDKNESSNIVKASMPQKNVPVDYE